MEVANTDPRPTNNLVSTPHRANQRHQNAQGFDRWLNSIRERIEGVFHEVQNTGRNIERLLAKTVLGLCTWVISKMTSHLLRHLLFDFSVVQIFEMVDTFRIHIRRRLYSRLKKMNGADCTVTYRVSWTQMGVKRCLRRPRTFGSLV